MNTQKVLQLAALLRMPETNDHFHMGYWIQARGRQEHQKAMEALHTCGTTACIAGWAVSMEMPNIRVAEM